MIAQIVESAYYTLYWRLDKAVLLPLEQLLVKAFSFCRSTMSTRWTSDRLAKVLGPR